MNRQMSRWGISRIEEKQLGKLVAVYVAQFGQLPFRRSEYDKGSLRGLELVLHQFVSSLRKRDLVLCGANITDYEEEADDFDNKPRTIKQTLAEWFGAAMTAIGWIIYRRGIHWRWPWWPVIGVAIWLPGMVLFYVFLP